MRIVENCQNMVYHLGKCGVFWMVCVGEKGMDEKEQKKVDEKEKCFVMMPISDQGDYPKGHFTKIYEQILKPAIEDAGYEAYRVDENSSSVLITDKIFKAIQECPMALCDLSNQNPNVLYELGLRQAYDKSVVLVQDEKTDKIFDVSGISTVFYESNRIYENVLEARRNITKAIMETSEGRHKSIVKIMQAQAAEIPTEKMTKEEKIEIMLSGLIDDIRDLKEESKIRSLGRNLILSTDSWGGTRWNPMEGNRKFEEYYTLPVKQGITNKQISRVIHSAKNIYNLEMAYQRKEGGISVYIGGAESRFDLNEAINYIKKHLN